MALRTEITLKATRAETAGAKLGWAIAEIVNLMYQRNTARNFMAGLMRVLEKAKREFNG